MACKILGIARDFRTNTPVVYATMKIADYLAMIGEDFENFAIQRRREKHKAYERMKKDVKEGALLPSITLAVRPEFVDELKGFVAENNFAALEENLGISGQVNILDGLQRTYILKEIEVEGHIFNPDQCVALEFWLENKLEHLIYRIIVLNAGQKPMSMRHQVELLFSTLKNKVESDIPNLQIITERESSRRTQPRKFPLDRLAGAYQSFITQSPEIKKENIVAQRLSESDVLDSDEGELFSQYESFITYLKLYSELDDEVCRVYPSSEEMSQLPAGTVWFGSENVMNSFFAAIAQLGKHEMYRARIPESFATMRNLLQNSAPGDDPLALVHLNAIIDALNPRKVNIGFATRRLLTTGFKEYFRESGAISLKDCWTLAAE
jgi:hypothetical protein